MSAENKNENTKKEYGYPHREIHNYAKKETRSCGNASSFDYGFAYDGKGEFRKDDGEKNSEKARSSQDRHSGKDGRKRKKNGGNDGGNDETV